MDDNYMTDEKAKTVGGFVEALGIFAKHYEDGQEKKFFMGAGHDEIFIYDSDEIPEDSEDGARLEQLGFHHNGDGWSYFT